MFPRHEAGMYLEHNRHKDYYESAAKYFENPWMEDFSDEDKKRCIEEDSIWELQWYPDTPVSFYKVIGTTFEEVLKKAKDIEI